MRVSVCVHKSRVRRAVAARTLQPFANARLTIAAFRYFLRPPNGTLDQNRAGLR